MAGLSYTVNEHGYAGYTHGCRCDICGCGKLEYQRELRARKQGAYKRRKYRKRASKYERAQAEQSSSPDLIQAWKDKLQGR